MKIETISYLNNIEQAKKLAENTYIDKNSLGKILVGCRITAPLWWWNELSKFKSMEVIDISSTMLDMLANPITRDSFDMDDFDGRLLMYEREPYDLDEYTEDIWDSIVCHCECLRKSYLQTKDDRYRQELLRFVPESFLYTKVLTTNYQMLRDVWIHNTTNTMIQWQQFCMWIETLPYARKFITYKQEDIQWL